MLSGGGHGVNAESNWTLDFRGSSCIKGDKITMICQRKTVINSPGGPLNCLSLEKQLELVAKGRAQIWELKNRETP